jgi:hypothetical protein
MHHRAWFAQKTQDGVAPAGADYSINIFLHTANIKKMAWDSGLLEMRQQTLKMHSDSAKWGGNPPDLDQLGGRRYPARHEQSMSRPRKKVNVWLSGEYQQATTDELKKPFMPV